MPGIGEKDVTSHNSPAYVDCSLSFQRNRINLFHDLIESITGTSVQESNRDEYSKASLGDIRRKNCRSVEPHTSAFDLFVVEVQRLLSESLPQMPQMPQISADFTTKSSALICAICGKTLFPHAQDGAHCYAAPLPRPGQKSLLESPPGVL